MEQPTLFEYDHSAPDLRETAEQERDGVARRRLIYRTPAGTRRVAELIRPAAVGSYAAILYVHWYEPEAANSNRTQFEAEAAELARSGVVSLLVETMWSDRDWFLKRTQADDYASSIEQVIELRQALDLLLEQPGVDARRLAYVGHDFGAMYGVLMGQADRRRVLEALSCVDAVHVFDELTPCHALELLRPHLFCKGGDYSEPELPEAEVVRSWGGRIAILPYVEGRSTTRLIEEVFGDPVA